MEHKINNHQFCISEIRSEPEVIWQSWDLKDGKVLFYSKDLVLDISFEDALKILQFNQNWGDIYSASHKHLTMQAIAANLMRFAFTASIYPDIKLIIPSRRESYQGDYRSYGLTKGTSHSGLMKFKKELTAKGLLHSDEEYAYNNNMAKEYSLCPHFKAHLIENYRRLKKLNPYGKIFMRTDRSTGRCIIRKSLKNTNTFSNGVSKQKIITKPESDRQKKEIIRNQEKLDNINTFNNQFQLSYITKERDFEPQEKFISKYPYSRLFSENAYCGGRFYHPIQQLTANRTETSQILERKTVFIDGRACVELDYKNFHPRLLLHKNNIEYPESKDIYNDFSNAANISRDLAKSIINISLNAESESSAMGAILNRHPESKRTEIKLAICFVPEEIKSNFYKSAWKKLQYIDSQIIERVMLKMMSLGLPCFTVHDSAITFKEEESTLREIMISAYREIVGPQFTPAIKEPEYTSRELVDALDGSKMAVNS